MKDKGIHLICVVNKELVCKSTKVRFWDKIKGISLMQTNPRFSIAIHCKSALPCPANCTIPWKNDKMSMIGIETRVFKNLGGGKTGTFCQTQNSGLGSPQKLWVLGLHFCTTMLCLME